MEKQEMKQRIKDYFVEIKEDKFTKVKTIKCKHNIIWNGKELENKFMLTKNSYSNELKMGVDYRHKDEVDSVFFTFIYTNSDGGYPGMTNIKMYLILDDDKNIELSEGSGFDHTSQSSKVGDNYTNVYLETAQLAVSMSDFIAIANAKKIEYSIRFGQGCLEDNFPENEIQIFKGFYNASFDNDFEIVSLSKFRSEQDIIKDIFFLNNLQRNLILNKELTHESMNSKGMMLWGNKYELKGEIIFGLSPNKLDGMMPIIFTSEGIYKQQSGSEPRYLAYSSCPEFSFQKGGFLSSNKLIDSKSKFCIDLASINPLNETGEKIINCFLNLIKLRVEKINASK